jgi:hypothetical protein
MAVALVRGDQVIPVSRYFPKFASWGDATVAPTIEKLTDTMPQHMLSVLAEDELLDSLLDLMAESDDGSAGLTTRAS